MCENSGYGAAHDTRAPTLDVGPRRGGCPDPPAGAGGRQELSRGAWVDHLPGWVAGSEDVLEVLLGDIGWREDRRQMYEREVAVPRLLRWYGGDETLPHPLLTEARTALNRHYGPQLGERFVSARMCLYPDR